MPDDLGVVPARVFGGAPTASKLRRCHGGHFRHPAVVREAAADHKDRGAKRDGREFGQVGPGAAQARELARRRRGATDASDWHPRGKHG